MVTIVSSSWAHLNCCGMHCIMVKILLMVMIIRDENTLIYRKETVVYVVNYTRQTPCPYCTYICELTYRYGTVRTGKESSNNLVCGLQLVVLAY